MKSMFGIRRRKCCIKQKAGTSLSVSVYSLIRSTDTMFVSRSLVIRTSQFRLSVTWSCDKKHITYIHNHQTIPDQTRPDHTIRGRQQCSLVLRPPHTQPLQWPLSSIAWLGRGCSKVANETFRPNSVF